MDHNEYDIFPPATITVVTTVIVDVQYHRDILRFDMTKKLLF